MKRWIWVGLVVIILIYLMSGVYQVGPSEVALVKTFGKYSYTTGPGIHFHLPFPIQSHVKVDVKTVRKIEIGFRTISVGRYESVPSEALMLTGDGNIVSVEAVVQYRISDPVNFAFKVIKDEELVRFTAESILRQEVAKVDIDTILTVGRDEIAMRTKEELQKTLNDYGVGIKVDRVLLQEVAPPEEVVEAFDDVNNAKQDKERMIKEAERYYNDVVPKAEGEAEKIIREAEAYANEVYMNALGEAQRFLKVLQEYEKAPEVLKKRMTYEAVEKFLKSSTVIVNTDESVLKLLNVGGVGR